MLEKTLLHVTQQQMSNICPQTPAPAAIQLKVDPALEIESEERPEYPTSPMKMCPPSIDETSDTFECDDLV